MIDIINPTTRRSTQFVTNREALFRRFRLLWAQRAGFGQKRFIPVVNVNGCVTTQAWYDSVPNFDAVVL
jgi:hypothetical protein